MLANNNQKIITSLAKRSLKSNKSKYGIMITAVMLSAFMLFGVLTVGSTYFKLQRVQGIRMRGGDYDIAMGNGITGEQHKKCMADENIKYAGIQAYAGYAVKTDKDSTLHTGMIWSDKTQWEQVMKPARDKLEGYYPEKYNELMVTKEALKDCGKEDLKPGDTFAMTYADKKGEHTEEFTISGIWEGHGPKLVFYVSEAMYRKSGYELGYNGIMNLKLKNSIIFQKDLSRLEKRLDLSGRQYFIPTADAQKSLGILAGIAGLIIVTCLSAYLLIYNILFLFVSGNIRYYGLLQTVGMTEKQISRLLLRQMLFVGVIGITGGILLGFAVSFLLIPAVVGTLGIKSAAADISFHPAIFLGSILLVGLTLYFCSRKPIRTAAGVSPVEAFRYRSNSGGRKTHKTGKGNVLWRMASEQLLKDKKRTAVTILSLAASLSVFLCMFTLIKGQDAGLVVSNNYQDKDITIQNDTYWNEDPIEWKQLMDSSFIKGIEETGGVKKIHPQPGARITVPPEPKFSDLWMRKFYEMWKDYSYDLDKKKYKQHPEKFYSFLKGADEDEFEVLNSELDTPVDRKSFLKGENCILYRGGLDLNMEQLKGKSVSFALYGKEDTLYNMKIAALTDDEYYAGTTGGAPIIIVSDTYLKSLVNDPYIMKMYVEYEAEYDKHTEAEIKKTINNHPGANDFSWDSKLESMEDMLKAQGNMMGIGTGITLILAWIGLMNYVNTVSVNIRTRKVTLAVMESIGMTPRQIRGMLVREGILYAAGALLLTVTAGLLIDYLCYELMNYQGLVFEIPFLPLSAAAVLVTALCILIPIWAYRHVSEKGTIVERIREFE